MSRQPTGPRGQAWDDERLEGAYRALAVPSAPEELTSATLAAVGLAANRKGRGRRQIAWPTLRRPRAVLAGGAVGLGLAAILAASLVLRSTPSASPAGAVPTTVDGLAVMTVSQALATEASGGDGLIAVEGWIDQMPVHSCPALPSVASVAALEGTCTSDQILLT